MVVRVSIAIILIHVKHLPPWAKRCLHNTIYERMPPWAQEHYGWLVVPVVCWLVPYLTVSDVSEWVRGLTPPSSSSYPNLLFNTLIAFMSSAPHFLSFTSSTCSLAIITMEYSPSCAYLRQLLVMSLVDTMLANSTRPHNGCQMFLLGWYVPK